MFPFDVVIMVNTVSGVFTWVSSDIYLRRPKIAIVAISIESYYPNTPYRTTDSTISPDNFYGNL